MGKVYSIKYTDNDDLPYARDPITVSASKMRCVQVPLTTEGRLTRLILTQTGGVDCDCLIDVLDSQVPYAPGEYTAGTAADDEIELYRVIPQQTLDNGGPAVLLHEEYGFPYHNQDGTYTDSQRYLYVILQPVVNSGAQTLAAPAYETTWEMAITVSSEVG